MSTIPLPLGAPQVNFHRTGAPWGVNPGQRTQTGWPVEADNAAWGLRCTSCGQARPMVAFSPGYQRADHTECLTCPDPAKPGRNLALNDDLWLTADTSAMLQQGLQRLAALDWWHSTSVLAPNFTLAGIRHVGVRAAAEHRLVSTESLELDRTPGAPQPLGPEYLVQPRDLRRVQLAAGVTIRGPVVVESFLRGAEDEIVAQFDSVPPGEAHAYINLQEAPGSLSLLLGARCVIAAPIVQPLNGRADRSLGHQWVVVAD